MSILRRFLTQHRAIRVENQQPAMEHRLFFCLAAALCLVWLLARLYDLESTPDGFYIDEAVGAAHISCIAEDLHDVNGRFMPLVVRAFDAQYYSGTHHLSFVYPAALWSKVFGSSRLSFKLFVALANLLALLALFVFLARRFNPLLGICVLLAFCLGPWSFHYSRVFWDPSLFVCYLLAGLMLLQLNSHKSVALAALAFVLAVYVYPPAKLAIPLFLLLALLLWAIMQRRWPPIRSLLLFVSLFVLLLAPQFWQDSTGASGKRFELVGFSHPEYLKAYGEGGFAYALSFIDKWLQHFSPQFLFFRGDGNLRHSVTGFGLLSWMDLAVLLALMFFAVRQWLLKQYIFFRPESALALPLLLALVGILSFSVPAALTWEGLPHATRVIGVWPFYAFMSGCGLYLICRRHRPTAYGLLVVAGVFSLGFLSHYWGEYRDASRIWFDYDQQRKLSETPLQGDWQRLMEQTRYEPEAVAYYMIQRSDCQSARLLLPLK